MMKTYRRELHQIPEISTQEKETNAYIFDRLKTMKLELTRAAGNGIIAYKKGNTGKHTIAFRSDMDGLRTKENTGLSFASKHEGVMHACGHDGHMAMLLSLAQYVSDNEFKSNIVLIFQPAEEFIGGAQPIVESHVLDKYNIEAFFAFHIMPIVPEGKIGIKPGPQMAHATEINVEIIGEAAHCAHPDQAIDAIYAASHLINQYQAITARNVPPLETAVINIGTIAGGQTRNIVCDNVKLSGTIRTFSDNVCEMVKKKVLSAGKGIEESFGCKVNTELIDFYPAVINDKELYEMVKSILPQEDAVETAPLMTAEDFSYYSLVAPEMFMILGSGSEKYKYPLHHSKFDFNEDIMDKGFEIYKKLIEHYESM